MASSSIIGISLILSLHDQMDRVRGRNTLGTCISKSAQIEAGKERLTRAEEDRRDCKMHLIDESSLQVLPYRRGSATDPNVFSLRCVASLVQSPP